MSIGKNIKIFRESKGISRRELANLLNINISSVTRYENGDREPSIDNIKKIATVLQIPIDILIGDELTPVMLDDYTFSGFENRKGEYFEDIDEYIKSKDQSKLDDSITTICAHRLNSDIENLPDEAIDKINEYIDMIALKYNKKTNK